MKIAVLVTGTVGETIGSKLIEVGHTVKMGSRTANNEKALAFANKHKDKASAGTFEDAAAYGELIFNCTAGVGSIDALKLAGESNLKGKIIIDLGDLTKARGTEMYLPLWLSIYGATNNGAFNIKIVS